MCLEYHCHDTIDSFGNVHATALSTTTYYTLQEMVDVIRSAHHKKSVEVGGFFDASSVHQIQFVFEQSEPDANQ